MTELTVSSVIGARPGRPDRDRADLMGCRGRHSEKAKGRSDDRRLTSDESQR